MGSPRVPIGELDLELKGFIYQPTQIRLDLWNAELRADITTTVGEVKVRAFVHSGKPVLAVELETTEAEKDAVLRWYPYPEVDHVLKNADGFNLNQFIPETEVERREVEGIPVGIQKYPTEEGCVTSWTEVRHSDLHRLFYLNVENGINDEAVHRSADAVAAARAELWDGFVESHRQWWHDYYRQSFVSIPDTRLESFYWIQMYKLASATRADGKIIDNQGPWLAPTPWAGVWFNMNVQMSYSPVYTSNRLELGESLVRALEENQETLIRTVPEAYRDDSAALGRSCSYDLVTKLDKEIGNLTWTLHNVWRQYRYSMDEDLLKRSLYPLLRRSINLYLHLLEEGRTAGFICRLRFPRNTARLRK
ncbi:hypothetical protein LJK88_09335 [Paenibacillus sp. P26]|nr:hypothetical protein LJK88_09335 [Paenibacillus sp. P26]